MSEQSVKATPFGGAERPSKAFGRGRVCRDPQCPTRLSMYNSGKYCYEHEPKTAPRTRGKKIA